MMKQDHHAYKTSAMKKNERDCSGFECQFLFRYLATNEGRFLAQFEVGTPHGINLHLKEQALAEVTEYATYIGIKNQHRPSNNDVRRLFKETLAEKQRVIIGKYHEAIEISFKARVRYFKARVLNRIKQQKPTKVQQPEPSSKNKIRSPKLQQDQMIDPQEKRKAPQDGPRAQQKQAVSKKREEGIMEGEANTIVPMKAPVERMAKEPVVKKSIEEMVRQMTLTMDEGLEDYKAEEKKVDSRIAAAEKNARATATAVEAAAASAAARAAAAAATATSEAASTVLIR